MSFIGAGIGFRGRYRRELVSDQLASAPAVLEIVPDHFFADPASIDPLAERYPLVFHDTSLSVATADGADLGSLPSDRANAYQPSVDRLARVGELVERARPRLFTEHLALTRSPEGIDVGHLAPIWFTEAQLDLVCARVERWQARFNLPVALENLATPFVIPGAPMTEAAFLTRVVERTGCGLLLDLTNIALSGRNFGFDARERLHDYPLHAVWQVHLAGGHWSPGAARARASNRTASADRSDRDHGQPDRRAPNGWWVDSHSSPVADESYQLLDYLRGRAPVRAIIVERDQALPPLPTLLAEAERAGHIWAGTAPVQPTSAAPGLPISKLD